MKRYNLFRHFFFAIALSSVLFFAVGCSDQPAPGPMSPVNSKKPLVAGQNQNSTGAVQPVPRRAAGNSLAKIVSYEVKANLHLQDLYDEMKYLATSNPGTTLASKMNSAAYYISEAQDDIYPVPDKADALGEIARAKSTLQGISTTVLNATTRNQFIAEIDAVVATINAGGTIDHDCRGVIKYLWMKKSLGGLIAHCGHKIIVPKNALKSDANMSIKIDNTSFITVDCGPDGTFNTPVTVFISYRDADMTGVNVSNLALAWYDTASGQWINLGGSVDSLLKFVSVLTNHFTEYTISTR